MATETTNFGLMKPDQEDFYDVSVANANMDKIDAAMVAARSAEEYNPASTYAVGDYCVHDSKLYRCTTAITAGETWTATHWTETTVAGELLVIIAALAGKADLVNLYTAGDITGIPPKAGSYYIGPDVTGMPINGLSWLASVDSDGATIAITAHNGNRRFIKYGAHGGSWLDWDIIPTATSPTQYDLPLASGVAAIAACKYFKTQDGVVTTYGQVQFVGNYTNDQQFATLPAGYRPESTFAVPGNFPDASGYIEIYPDGTIKAIGGTDGTQTWLRFTATFVAS